MDPVTPSHGGWWRGFAREKGILAAFVVLYMVVFGTMAVVRGNREFVFYGVVMVVLIGLVLFADRRVGFSKGVLWCLAVWGLMHMAGGNARVGLDEEGNALVLYSWRPLADFFRYDQVVHAFGFFTATLASWEGLAAGVRSVGRVRATPGLVFGAVLMGMGFGAVNEVVEFAAVMLLPNTNVGGYVNTGWDLVSNTVGATAAGLLVLWRGSRGED